MRAVTALAQAGLIEIRARYTEDGKQTSNRFVLLIRGDKNNRVGVTKTTPDTVRDIPSNKSKGGDKNAYPAEFEEWWNLYPRKDGSKRKAFEIWKRATDRDISARELFLATARFKQTCHGKDKKFIPHATTWLNQGRWETVQEAQEQTTTRNMLAG